MATPINILFLCTGNSARSILSEAMANDPAIGQGKLRAWSAGSHPTGRVNPGAIDWLRSQGIATDGLCSESWDRYAEPGAPALDVVITVCGNAAAETCPLWPGKPITAHWGVDDPAGVGDDAAAVQAAFARVAAILKRRIEAFVALPLDAMTADERLQAARRIGEDG